MILPWLNNWLRKLSSVRFLSLSNFSFMIHVNLINMKECFCSCNISNKITSPRLTLLFWILNIYFMPPQKAFLEHGTIKVRLIFGVFWVEMLWWIGEFFKIMFISRQRRSSFGLFYIRRTCFMSFGCEGRVVRKARLRKKLPRPKALIGILCRHSHQVIMNFDR